MEAGFVNLITFNMYLEGERIPNPWVGKIPWNRRWQPTPVFVPEKSCGQRNLVGYSPWRCKESDPTEQLSKHTLVVW